jgi:hypothetical protein
LEYLIGPELLDLLAELEYGGGEAGGGVHQILHLATGQAELLRHYR